MASTSFSFTIEPASGSGSPSSSSLLVDFNSPFVLNLSPVDGETGLSGLVEISMDILDDISVDINTIKIMVDDEYAFIGPATFHSNWNSLENSITPISIDEYNGYHLVVKRSSLFDPRTYHSIRVLASDQNTNSLDQTTYFTTGSSISSVSAGIYEINLTVTYTHDMLVNSALFSPANYQFNNGMYARNATLIDNKNVLLEVENFHTFEEFTLTVNSNIKDDAYGDSLPIPYSSIDFGPFQSDANISNFNGKIRTWRSGNVIQADSERIYIAGDRGIDVFRKLNPSNPVRWGQILDEYGAQAMFVLNYPNDLVITDTLPPYLIDLNPDENATVPSVSTIELTITDLNTAVEPTSTTIYVNNNLVFRGSYGGWVNNYSGNLIVEYQKLNFTLIPPIAFSINDVIIVRVLATDLLGNSLDKTYQFSIGTSAIIEGWGGQNWGSYDAYGFTLFGWGGV